MQVAAANDDFITPSVISAAEADYERNLANTIDLVYLLANDEEHGAAQPQAVPGLARASTRTLADEGRQPACSRSGRSRIPSRSPYEDVRPSPTSGIGQILGELGLNR